MRRLTESVASFSLALSAFAARQATLLAPAAFAPRCRERLGQGFDAVAWEAQNALGETLRQAFQVGDALQRDVVDLSLPKNPLWPGDWLAAGLGAWTAAARTLRFTLPPEDAALAWREIANKLMVYSLVRGVGRRIGTPPPGEPFPVEELVRRAYRLEEYAALWAVEGLGHDWTQSVWRRESRPPHGLLSGDRGRSLPPESRLMLHAGLGLGLAQPLLEELPPDAPPARARATVQRFVALCRDNARPGSVGASYESLGLVTRTFFPGQMTAVQRVLREEAPQVEPFFWHGVGRALYFLPINFLPWGDTSWRPFEMAWREACDAAARRDAVSGLAWAATLVGMQDPEILARLILGRHGCELEADDAFASGVAAAVTMRRDTTPGAALLDRFLAHRPADPALAGRWERLVQNPAREVLEQGYPVIRDLDRLGEIFRYQPMDRLAAGRLEAAG